MLGSLFCFLAAPSFLWGGGSGTDSPFDFGEEYTFELEFGGLKPGEEYEVYYDGIFRGRIRTDATGTVRVPMPWNNRAIEMKEYLHSEFAVENWDAYE